MKVFFCVALAGFGLMYVVAVATLQRPTDDGVVHLRWATDPNPARDQQVAEFSRLFPGLSVSVDPSTVQKIIVRCATGTGPDIIDVYSTAQMLQYVDAGILLDLTPYASAMGFDPGRTYPAVAQDLMVEGRQYRFPCNVCAGGVVFNKRIFDDHDVPYPPKDWTWQDLVRIGRAIHEAPSKSGKKHLAMASGGTGFFYGLLFSYGGRLYSEDGLFSALDSAEAVAALQFYHDLIFVHNVMPTGAEIQALSKQGGWGTGGITLFCTERTAMLFIGRWFLVQLPNYAGLREKVGAVMTPRVPGRATVPIVTTRAAGINVKSPHWKEALKFLQYLAGPAYGRIIVQDGDGLPPNPHLARRGEDLVNEWMDDPSFHQAFIDQVHCARPIDVSPFIDPSLVDTWLRERIEQIENRITVQGERVTPEAALKSLAREINKRIRQNLARQPNLQRTFERVTGQKYSPDWWKRRREASTWGSEAEG